MSCAGSGDTLARWPGFQPAVHHAQDIDPIHLPKSNDASEASHFFLLLFFSCAHKEGMQNMPLCYQPPRLGLRELDRALPVAIALAGHFRTTLPSLGCISFGKIHVESADYSNQTGSISTLNIDFPERQQIV